MLIILGLLHNDNSDIRLIVVTLAFTICEYWHTMLQCPRLRGVRRERCVLRFGIVCE